MEGKRRCVAMMDAAITQSAFQCRRLRYDAHHTRFAVRLLLPAVVPGQQRPSITRGGHRERPRVRHIVAYVDRPHRLRVSGHTVRGAPGGRAQVPGTRRDFLLFGRCNLCNLTTRPRRVVEERPSVIPRGRVTRGQARI